MVLAEWPQFQVIVALEKALGNCLISSAKELGQRPFEG
jgi:hypothetical protein